MHLSQSLQRLVSKNHKIASLFTYRNGNASSGTAGRRMKEGKHVYPSELNTLSIHLTRVLLRLQDCRVTSPFYCRWNNGIFDTGNWPPLWTIIPLWIIHNIRCICRGGVRGLKHPPPPPQIWNNYVFFFFFCLLACLSERLVMCRCTRIPLSRIWKIDNKFWRKKRKGVGAFFCFVFCLLACQRGWWCVDTYRDTPIPYLENWQQIVKEKKKRCRSLPPPPPPQDFFRAARHHSLHAMLKHPHWKNPANATAQYNDISHQYNQQKMPVLWLKL